MELIGEYYNRKVYWLNYDGFSQQLSNMDWVCVAIANRQFDVNKFDDFVRISIARGIVEFKGWGELGEKLHDLFDETIVVMETMESQKEIEVITTWHDDETLADVLWQSFFIVGLSDSVDFDDIAIVCTDMDGEDRREELLKYINEFKLGWIPDENVKHEVWEDMEGFTTLCLADERGNDCRNLLEPGSKLIHVLYANSHYEAMTIYYEFMKWGTYTTEFEIDRQPYEKI